MKKDFDPLRLPPELWLEIFMKNTELHYRLKTARHCSQVCQLCRTILLSSSSTWGRLLVLHEFVWTADEWKELILRRVGNSLLWIHGPISYSTWHFLQTIVDSKWENVQIFDECHTAQAPPLSPETSAYLEKPAPNLEVFALKYAGHIYPAPRKPFIQNMFGNLAPRLRSFEISSSIFDVNSTLPWIPNLHTIHFHEEYYRDDIFTVLNAMPRVEFIHITLRAWSDEPLTPDFTPHLPRLRGLEVIGGDLPDALPFLELIKASDQMGFLVVDIPDRTPNVQNLSSRYHHALVPFILSYMKRCAPRFLTLETDDRLRIFDHPPSTSGPYFETGSLDVHLFLDSNGHSALADLVASGSFSSVEQLLIDVGDKHEALIPLYEALTSVTELEASYLGIPALHADREQKQSVLFPKLRILRISFDGRAPRDTSYLSQVFDYVEYRARVGLPLSCLDLSDCSPLEPSDGNRERLDKLTGLTVELPS
ncbi:hypothetical protein D9613_011873 [Agrocybe pediades]|uniref:F-box domain-containing protein n=1 Tax=Agrocybe pediades TaxID=84607 RepID=A0A8H4QKV1_9AGAR|nr:hypothetical protein D9613_011873 [Agrocybe pediades]